MSNKHDKSENLIFDKYFLNLNYSITATSTELQFYFHVLYTHSEGTVSQISHLGLSSFVMPKIGKLFEKYVKFIFKVT